MKIKPDNPEAASMLFIFALWGIMIAVANPIGDFPLIDDWAYAESVRALLNDHRLVISDWSAMNLLTQIVWGWAFSLVMEPSFTVLRVSVLVLGLLGAIAAFKLSLEAGVPLPLALLGAVLLIVNPVYFTISHTFMTDVPFFSFSAISLLFLARAVNQDKTQDIAAGTVILVFALLIRQLGFAIAIAYALAYMAGRRLSLRAVVRASLPLLACLFVQLSFRAWLDANNQLPAMHGYQIEQIKHAFSLSVLDIATVFELNVFKTLLSLALFLLPLILLIFFYMNKKIDAVTALLLVIGTLLLYYSLRLAGMQLFLLQSNIQGAFGFGGNILNAFGVGPSLQYGAVGYSPQYRIAVGYWWLFVGLLVIFAAGLMLHFSYVAVRGLWLNKSGIMSMWFSGKSGEMGKIRLYILFGASTLIYCVPTFLLPTLYDRYLLLPMLTTSLLMQLKVTATAKLSRSKIGIVVLMTVFAAIVTSLTTHDYLAWNRVRWAALDHLIHRQGIAPERIDGGFEFNGMYLFSKDHLRPGAKGWWVVDNEYLIAFSSVYFERVKGYKVVARYPIEVYLPFSPRNIYVLYRK